MSGSPIKKGTVVWEKDSIVSRVDYDAEYSSKLINQSIRVFSDGRLVYANEAQSFEENPILSLLSIRVQYFMIGEEGKNTKRCLIVTCQTAQSQQRAQLRIVAEEPELQEFLRIVKSISKDHNIDTILEESVNSKERVRNILFDHQQVMFTALRERRYLFSLMWKSWAPRTVKIYSDGTLTYTHPYMREAPLHHTLKLKNIEVTLLTDANLQTGGTESNFGLNIKLQTLKDVDTYIRCILSDQKVLDEFLWAMKTVATTHNIDRLQRASMKVDEHQPRLSAWTGMPKSSAMRRAVCRSIDYHQKKSRVDQIVGKRGVMKWLPVIGSNDLVHGSW